MANPYHHSLSSVKKWGGVVDDYQSFHDWFDFSKQLTADFRHRALRHHAEGIFMLETIFGKTVILSTGRIIPTRWISRRDLSALEGADDGTVIALHGRCFLDVQNEKSRYFLDIGQEQPVAHTEFVDAYAGSGNTVFYRGIRIHQTQFPLLFRYNLLEQVTLTEDRTLKYAFSLNDILEKAIITSEDHDFVRRTLTAGDATHEGRLEFDGSYFGAELSAAFKSVCSYLLERMPENANKNALRYYQKQTSTNQPLQTATLT